MKVSIRVKARAKLEQVEKIGETDFRVSVKAEAKEGRANHAVVELLSRYFDIPKSRIAIVRGHTSKNKIVEIIPG